MPAPQILCISQHSCVEVCDVSHIRAGFQGQFWCIEGMSCGGRSRTADASTQGAAAVAGFVDCAARRDSRGNYAVSIAGKPGEDRARQCDTGAAVLLAADAAAACGVTAAGACAEA